MRKLTSQEKKAVYNQTLTAAYAMYVRIDNREEEEITAEVIKDARNAAYKAYADFGDIMNKAMQRDIIDRETFTVVNNAVIGAMLEIFDRLANKESAEDSLEETNIVLDKLGYLE